MFLRKLSIILTTSTMLLLPASNVAAASFNTGETKQIQHYQKLYAELDKKEYDDNNLYQKNPHLRKKFNSGRLKKKYINSQLDYINYYRSLFGLPPISSTKVANQSAQKTAAVMAAINANPFVNQHGLPSDIKPNYVSKSLWKLAQDTSETSNLNFNVSDQSAGDVITDLLTDHYNLSGLDTGHRAWLLSTRLTSTGIGAAYGSNGYRYSVQKVLNIDDLFRPASQNKVAYPSTGLFPIELVKGKNIAWSLYLSDKSYNGKPKIKITDKDTGKSYTAKKVSNYSDAGYGNFKTVITYLPGKTPLVAGHEYVVNINGLDKYNFKLFKQDTSTEKEETTSKPGTYQKASVQQNTNLNTPFSRTNAKLWAAFHPNKVKKRNQYFDVLRKGNWHYNFFLLRVLQLNKVY